MPYTYLMTIFGCGRNYYGEFGEKINNRGKPRPLGQWVTDVRIGYGFIILQIFGGKICAMGKNSEGNLGIGRTSSCEKKPTPLNINTDPFKPRIRIKQIFLNPTSHSTFFKDSEHNIYGFGKNSYGNLGLGQEETVSTPTKINFFEEKIIYDIQSSQYHSLALTKDGSVYSVGFNWNGCLGHGRNIFNNEQISKWKRLKTLQKIIQIGVGDGFSLFLNSKFEMYGVGYNNFGNLGLGHSDSDYKRQIDDNCIKYFRNKNIKIVSFKCGFHHVLSLTHNNKVYGWGANERGELGFKSDTNITIPTKIEFFENDDINVIDIKVGYNHSCVICVKEKKKQIYLFGNNSNRQCCVYDSETYSKDIKTPTQLNLDKVMKNALNTDVQDINLGCYNTILLIKPT
eukprot:282043_1